MGAGKSRHVPFSHEEACHRIDAAVLTRIEETFKRASTANGYLPQNTFTRDIMGDGVPPKLAEELYHAFGGSQKGMSLKDLVCGLALLTHSSVDEKAKFLSLMLSADSGSVSRDAVNEVVAACDVAGRTHVDLDTLFHREQSCSASHFEEWIKKHPNLSSFTKWLLVPGQSGFSLAGEPDPPTFYQTLGKQHGLSEKEVMDLERTYWSLKSGITTGGSSKFDQETFTYYASPPVPEPLCKGLFALFDENCDGQLDLSEMVRAVGWCCRKSGRHDLCFKVFDEDGDDLLSRSELTSAVTHLQTILRENTPSELAAEEDSSEDTEDVQVTVEAAMEKFAMTREGFLTEEEYMRWAESATPLSVSLLHVLYQVCHIRFGLRPCTKTDETTVVGGYLLRSQKTGQRLGDTVYIIDSEWFRLWKRITGYEICSSPLSVASPSSGKKKKKRHKKHRHHHRSSSPQVHILTEPGMKHASTQTPPSPLHRGGLVERGEDVVETLTAAQGGNGRRNHSNSSYTAIDDTESSSQAGSGSARVAGENRIPPIDNSPLLAHDPSTKKYTSLTNEGGFIVKNKVLVEGDHYFVLPDVVWKVFTSWYGVAGHQGGPALPRLVKDDGSIDFYPVQFKVYRHTTLLPAGKPSSLPWPIASVFGTLGIVSNKPAPPPVLSSAGVGSGGTEGGPIQPPLPRRVLYYNAAFTTATTVAEMSSYIEKVLHVKSEDLRLYNLSDEENPVHLDNENMTVADLKFADNQKLLIETRNKDNSWPEEIIAVMKEVRGKDGKEGKGNTDKTQDSDVQVPQGATGLSNLGNTCFMNSALQCVSNVQPLTQYFRERDYLLEINKGNPLGMGGVMAKRYGELVQDIWSGHAKSITPLKFRFTVGRCAPRFNGFQQQDAQELLAFVLDGLHEDLNRVKEKPYKELKDSDGRPDDEVSREAWDYHLSRNRSVIVDLFQGQLKSEVRCKVCNYKSVRFDPFTFLSLPLPMESTVNLETVVVRLDGNQPVRYGLKLEVDDKYRSLLVALSRLTGIKTSNLLLVEMYGSMIRSFPPDSTKIRAQLGGWLYAFEIPDLPPPPTFRTITIFPTSTPHTTVTSSPTVTSTGGVRGEEIGGREREEGGEEEEEEGMELRVEEDEADERKEGMKECVTQNIVQDGGGEGNGREAANTPDGGGEGNGREAANTPDGGGEGNGRDAKDTSDGGGEGNGREDTQRNDLMNTLNRESRDSFIGGTEDMECSMEDLRPVLDRPLGSRDPTPPILLTAEEDDRITGDAATGLRAAGEEGTPRSHDPGMVSHDRSRGIRPSGVSPLHSGVVHDGFIFAIHRKTFLVEQYFVASQKNRPVLFGTPVVVPCTPATPCRVVYERVWRSVERLIIPDKPSENNESKEKTGYPFKLSLVGKDGLLCATCPWHMFCRGCPVPCDDSGIGDSSSYIAIDWDINILHLKYQSAQERPVEHESMESLKTMDLDPIDLYECFKAFVRQDDLGDEECWYCKQCKTHQEAVKSLEIWRLPPILIIHLKRFQFCNGRWVKSQRVVQFPIKDMDPLRFTVQNGNQTTTGNGMETSQSRTTEDRVGQVPLPADTRQANTAGESENQTSVPLANGGDHPVISEGVTAGVGGGERSQDQLDETLYRREGNMYNLVAITCHTGVLGGGHYTSFCKNPNGMWYYFNDSSCKETTEECIAEESPYMLFYEMKDLDHYYNLFRALKGGKRQDISSTDDDKAYEETLHNLSKKCCIQ